MNVDDNLSRAGPEIGRLFQLHHFGTAELVYTDGFHGFLLRRKR